MCQNGKCCLLPFRGKRCLYHWLENKWHTMNGRVRNRSGRYTSYDGLPIISKAEFMQWGLGNPPSAELKVASIDRIVPSIGYVLGNIRWIEFSDNARGNQRDTPIGFWICYTCKRLLPETSEFFPRSCKRKNGLHPQCKKCQNKRRKLC